MIKKTSAYKNHSDIMRRNTSLKR